MGFFNFWLSVILILIFLWAGIGGPFSDLSSGDPETGLWGAVCFLGAFIYVLARRSGFFRRKHFLGELHLSLGLVGGMLVVLHSGGRFSGSAGFLTLPLMVLFLLGMNLRFFCPRQVFRSFHSKAVLFFHPVRGESDLGKIIRRKEALLRNLDKNGQEGIFGLRFGDWLRSPFAAAQYSFLARKERERVRQACGSPPVYLDFTEGWGRYLHILVGIGALAGILFHLIQFCPYFSY